MTEKRFTKQESTIEKYMLYDNNKENAYFITCDEGTINAIVDLLNEQSINIQGLLLDRSRQEEKLDIARRNMSKQLEKIGELEKENEQLRHWNKCLAEKRHNENETKGNLIKKLLSKIDFLERIIEGDV